MAGCPAPTHPHASAAVDSAIELGRTGSQLRGVAGDGRVTFAAIATGATSEIKSAAWTTPIEGVVGPIAYAQGLVIATLATTALHGQPGSMVIALDAATGAVKWKLVVDSSEWATIAAIAATRDGIAIGGSYAGTLRVADATAGTAGRADGFVAHVGLDGKLAWLVRVGGEFSDGIAGVALAGDRVAIAGTFAPGADVLGQELTSIDERSFLADDFVAELDGAGHLVWAKAFGSAADDHVAGVAIDAQGRVVVAAIAREAMHLDGNEYIARGAADGLVAWFSPTGATGAAILLGGTDFDGLRAICAIDDRVVVGGFFSGSMQLGARTLAAGGGDDAFLAALDNGKVVAAWPISGVGREEIVALSPIPHGFVAGLAHTAAVAIGKDTLAAPADPLAGFGVFTRGL
jgi:outer membrane protein assembly factor BamB